VYKEDKRKKYEFCNTLSVHWNWKTSFKTKCHGTTKSNTHRWARR